MTFRSIKAVDINCFKGDLALSDVCLSELVEF